MNVAAGIVASDVRDDAATVSFLVLLFQVGVLLTVYIESTTSSYVEN